MAPVRGRRGLPVVPPASSSSVANVPDAVVDLPLRPLVQRALDDAAAAPEAALSAAAAAAAHGHGGGGQGRGVVVTVPAEPATETAAEASSSSPASASEWPSAAVRALALNQAQRDFLQSETNDTVSS